VRSRWLQTLTLRSERKLAAASVCQPATQSRLGMAWLGLAGAPTVPWGAGQSPSVCRAAALYVRCELNDLVALCLAGRIATSAGQTSRPPLQPWSRRTLAPRLASSTAVRIRPWGAPLFAVTSASCAASAEQPGLRKCVPVTRSEQATDRRARILHCVLTQRRPEIGLNHVAG
jgi:hypothetical protein